jgi:hypothetical protein
LADRRYDAVVSKRVVMVTPTERRNSEPFSSFGLAGLKNVDGLGEMAGTPGAAA